MDESEIIQSILRASADRNFVLLRELISSNPHLVNCKGRLDECDYSKWILTPIYFVANELVIVLNCNNPITLASEEFIERKRIAEEMAIFLMEMGADIDEPITITRNPVLTGTSRNALLMGTTSVRTYFRYHPMTIEFLEKHEKRIIEDISLTKGVNDETDIV